MKKKIGGEPGNFFGAARNPPDLFSRHITLLQWAVRKKNDPEKLHPPMGGRSGGVAAVAGVAERPEIGPPEAEARVCGDRLDVVDIGCRCEHADAIAEPTERLFSQHDQTKACPEMIVAALGWAETTLLLRYWPAE